MILRGSGVADAFHFPNPTIVCKFEWRATRRERFFLELIAAPEIFFSYFLLSPFPSFFLSFFFLICNFVSFRFVS